MWKRSCSLWQLSALEAKLPPAEQQNKYEKHTYKHMYVAIICCTVSVLLPSGLCLRFEPAQMINKREYNTCQKRFRLWNQHNLRRNKISHQAWTGICPYYSCCLFMWSKRVHSVRSVSVKINVTFVKHPFPKKLTGRLWQIFALWGFHRRSEACLTEMFIKEYRCGARGSTAAHFLLRLNSVRQSWFYVFFSFFYFVF